MTAQQLFTALTARANAVDTWDFTVDDLTDEDGDGRIVLTVTYSEDTRINNREVEQEPWDAFGPFPTEPSASGIDNDEQGHVSQWAQWNISGGDV